LKVVLVNPPQLARYPQPPMGLAMMGAVLEREGYQVAILDANALGLQPEDVASRVADADVVGLTAITPTINTAIGIAHHLKQANPHLTVILGGPHATLLPEETLATAPDIDIIVRGEGEGTFIKLLRDWKQEQPLANTPAISYRQNGKVTSTPAGTTIVDLDSLPFFAYHLLPRQKYKPHPPYGRALPFAAIITSRGCPYNCSYCSKPVFGNRFRGQSPERVVEEIAYYKDRFGIKELAFYDDVFTLNKERAYAIADGIMKRGLKLLWTCETRVNLVDKELLRHIKQAGCYSIAYGIESGSQEILNTLDKDISLEQVEEAVHLSQEVNLQTIGYFMIGSPGESPETVSQTIQFAKKLKLDFAQFAVTMPFPGTRLYRLYLDSRKNDRILWESFVYDRAGSQIAPVFETNVLSRTDLQYWIRRAYKEFYLRPSYLWRQIRQTTSIRDLKVNIKGLLMFLGNIRPL